MASDIIRPFSFTMDNIKPYWNGNTNFQPCRNSKLVKPRYCAPKTDKRPQFLRLDSTGEHGDSSPEPDETFPREAGYQKKHSDHRAKRASRNIFTEESLPKARRTNYSSQLNFQGNSQHSKESLDSAELDQLATKFSSFFTSKRDLQKEMDSGIQTNQRNVNMAGFCGDKDRFQCGGTPYPPPNPNFNSDMSRLHGFPCRPPHFQPPAPSQANRTHNIMSMPISMLNFRPPPFTHPPPRWVNPPMPCRLPVNFAPWAFSGHIPHVQNESLAPPRVNIVQQAAQYNAPRNAWQQHSPQRTKHNRHQPCKKNNSKMGRNNQQMYTKILQRPSKPVNDSDVGKGKPAKEIPADAKPDTTVDAIDGKVPDLHEKVSTKQLGKSASQVQALEYSPKPVVKEAFNPCPKESNIEGTKQRHSTIDFLLGGLAISHENLSDSDFIDGDWDTLDNLSSLDKTWADSFLSDDPYNPLTGWQCSKRAPLDELSQSSDHSENRTSATWTGGSPEFDSGTESGSEGDTTSESEGDWDENGDGQIESVSGGSVTEGSQVLGKTAACESGQSNSDSCNWNTPRNKTPSIQKSINTCESRDSSENSDNSSRRQKCLHPSISYVLGGYDDQRASDDGSDVESDDWDDFSDSDDESFISDLTTQCTPPKRDQLNLFQFKNPCLPSFAGPQGTQSPSTLPSFAGPQQTSIKEKTSPSVPCGPIFKPKSRTVLISQRIICQVSDQPVSMVVPLEQSGRMSQNMMPSIQVSPVLPRLQSLPTSCIKLGYPGAQSKTTKQVRFSNKAVLIVCPEPSHLVDEIKRTRRGPWLDYARDRCRFQHRISHLERVIGPCLSEEHRKKVADRMQQQQEMEALGQTSLIV